MVLRDLSFSSLVNLEEWQRLQDSFAEVLEVTLRTFSREGELLTKISRPNRLCNKVSPNHPAYADSCGKCILKKNLTNSIEAKQQVNFKCIFGLDLFSVPISAVGNGIISYIVIGPLILNRRKDISEDAEIAEKLGIELENLVDAMVEINVFSYSKVYAATKLVGNVFSHIAQTGYHKKRLGEMAPEIRELDPLFSRYYEEKILNSLLNVCTLALNADSGSVMTMDKKTKMLHIKVASKLDEDVVNNTNIKVGEGIAGVAAATAKPIILPEDEEKQGLAEKMKRKYIKSSMIVPFRKALGQENSHEVYGVINLNMVKKEQGFSERDIALVKELVNLASIALAPLKAPPNN